jgi:hypothetical protein
MDLKWFVKTAAQLGQAIIQRIQRKKLYRVGIRDYMNLVKDTTGK